MRTKYTTKFVGIIAGQISLPKPYEGSLFVNYLAIFTGLYNPMGHFNELTVYIYVNIARVGSTPTFNFADIMKLNIPTFQPHIHVAFT